MSSAPDPGSVPPAQRRRAAHRQRASCLSGLLFVSLAPLTAVAGAAPPPQPPVIDAPEVAISATRTARSVLDLPGNVTVIDRAAIERSGARSVPDLLRREAGLMVTSLGSTPEGFTVEARGFNNGGGNGCSTLVLVDGRRINEPETGCPDWSFVALEEIDRIEIVRGPASVAYGDNAAAGVIHIFTIRPREAGLRAAGQFETGSYGMRSGAGRVSGRSGGAFATAFFGHSDANGYRDQSDFNWDAARLGIGADLGEVGELRVDGGYDSNFRQRPGALSEAEMDADRRQADPDSLGDFDRARSRFLMASADLKLGEDVRVRILPYTRRRSDAGTLSGDDGFGGSFDFVTDSETEQLGIDAQLEVGFDAFGQRHTFLTGGELRREDSDVRNLFASPGFSSDTKVRLRRDTWGVFAQQEIGLREDLHLLLGVRRDQIRYDGSGFQDAGGFLTRVVVDEEPSVWSPRAALTWRVSEPIALYAGYARGFRSANVQETVSLFGVAPVDPQKTESYEIGGKLRSGRFGGNLALYWMNVRNEILFDPFTFANVNLGRVRHRGVELSGTVRVVEWLELHASYTYDDVRIRSGILTDLGPPALFTNAGRIPLTPKHRGAAGATVFLPCGFELGVDALWIGSRPLVNDLDNDSEKLPPYAVVDARAAWRGAHGPFSLVLEALGKNLTNRDYSEFGGEATFGGAPGFYPAAERNFVVGARVEVRR
jgi:iron complex outermembrane recepter protein